MSALLIQLILASGMVVVTVLVHLIGLGVLMRMLRGRRWVRIYEHLRPITLLVGASIGIFAIHTIEIWLYAAVYIRIGAIAGFEQALYFSTVTYATIGYGDLLLPHAWRIFGAIEGATGIIMLGWSTAFLVSLLARLNMFRHDWLTPDDGA